MSSFSKTASGKLNAIAKVSAAAANGLATCVYISEAADLTSIPARTADTNIIATDIVFDAGKFFASWHVGEEESQISINSIGTQGSSSFETTLTLFVPGTHDQAEEFLNEGINDEFVIVAPDRNGVLRLIGADYSPAFIPADGIEFVNTNEKEGFTITFKQRGKFPPVYTGAIATS
jgi:hypothetical protein